jgi:glycosyltransferase involved in cell wall biosynthesis
LPDIFADAHNIGYFFWELNTPAECHQLALDFVDEVWVSSDYNRDTFKNFTPSPVTNVGLAFEDIPNMERLEGRRFLAERIGARAEDFVFLCAFDSFSMIYRKNPSAVVEAFRAAFPDNDMVKLVLKTQNRSRLVDKSQTELFQFLERASAEDPRIKIIDDALPYRDFMLLKKGADCYVSLHRSEGWGFGMLEAMNLGVPVITTGYSGNMEYCKPETCWLVDYDLVEVEAGQYLYVRPEQVWANPRMESAIAAMQEVFLDRNLGRRKASAAHSFVRSNFSIAAIAERYSKRIAQILSLKTGRAREIPP